MMLGLLAQSTVNQRIATPSVDWWGLMPRMLVGAAERDLSVQLFGRPLPTPLLMAQAFKERGEAVAEMKAEGIEYDERMELLEQVTHPQPLAEPLDWQRSSWPRRSSP